MKTLRDMRDIYSGLAIMAVSAFLFWQTLGGGIVLFEDDIDPMIYPRVITILLAGLGFIVFVRGLLKNSPADSVPIFSRRTVGVSLVMLAYAYTLNYIGFAISSFCAGCGVAYIMGWRKPVPLFLINACAVFLMWLLFVKALRIPLPAGTIF